MNIKRIFIIQILVSSTAFAQKSIDHQLINPPVNFEFLIGDNGLASQMIINKAFKNTPRIGFFSATNISSKWGESVSMDAMSQANLTLEIIKGLRIFGGFHYTPITGLRPTSALMYTVITNDLLISLGPRIDIIENGNVEGFVMIEYKPKLNEKWDVYSRLQSIYSETLNTKVHARSYLMLRAGFSYKDFSFGLGSNWDSFGPEKIIKENYGVFLIARLFN